MAESKNPEEKMETVQLSPPSSPIQAEDSTQRSVSSVYSHAGSTNTTSSNLRQEIRERRLSAFLETSRQADDLHASSTALQQELDAHRIAPELANAIDDSFRSLEDTLNELGRMVTNETRLSRMESTGAFNFSRVSDFTDITELRNQINAADDAWHHSDESGNDLLLSPTNRRSMLTQAAPPTRSSLSPSPIPSQMVQEDVNKEDERTKREDDGFKPTTKQQHMIFEKKVLVPTLLTCLVAAILILYTMSSSNSTRSLPPASIPTESRSSIGEKLPRSSAAPLPYLSDGTLHNAFEALVGDDIHRRGSSQHMAAWQVDERCKPLHDEQGELDGFETIESSRWLSGYSECSWAGIVCKHMETDGGTGLDEKHHPLNAVVEINLEGQIRYETVVTEIFQLPHLELLSY